MGWRSFLLGIVIGVAAMAGVAALRPHPKNAANETITLSDKQFFDSAKTDIGDGTVRIVGTVIGDQVGYKNNTLTAWCRKDQDGQEAKPSLRPGAA